MTRVLTLTVDNDGDGYSCDGEEDIADTAEAKVLAKVLRAYLLELDARVAAASSVTN